jgi:hypothetical protein
MGMGSTLAAGQRIKENGARLNGFKMSSINGTFFCGP